MVRLLRKQVSGRRAGSGSLDGGKTALFLSPHRLEMDRRILVALSLVAACAAGDSSSHGSGAKDSSAGAPAESKSSGEVAAATTGTAAPNLQGRIPVLEYHVIGGDKNSL